jgi:cobalt-zinc-cadmium efflux system membrane fusion protein
MKNILLQTCKLLSVALIAGLSLPSCHSTAAADNDDNKAAAPAKKKSTDTIELSQKQVSVSGITTGFIEQKNVGSVVKASGQLVLPPSHQAVVTTAIAGIISEIPVKEGSEVRQGQAVAYIESPELIRLQQDYMTTKSNLVYVQQEYERQKLLNDENAGTGKVYQQAKANFISEQQKLQAMAASLAQLHVSVAALNKGQLIRKVPIIAPLSGQVNHVYIMVGSPADVNKPIIDIINNKDIYCDLKIFEKDINRVKVGQKAELSLSGQEQQVIHGTIYALNSEFETDNRVVIAHVRLNDAGNKHLIPGSYASASVITDNVTTPALPEEAIVSADGKQYIFLALGQDDDNKGSKAAEGMNFKKVEVVTGASDMGFVGIKLLTDLPKDAKVVTKGAKYILAESQKGDASDDD